MSMYATEAPQHAGNDARELQPTEGNTNTNDGLPWTEQQNIMRAVGELYTAPDDMNQVNECAQLAQTAVREYTEATRDARQVVRGFTQSVERKRVNALEKQELETAEHSRDQMKKAITESEQRITQGEAHTLSRHKELQRVEEQVLACEQQAQQDKQAELASNLEVTRYSLSLYATITHVKWDLGSSLVAGHVVRDGADARLSSFEFDPAECSAFDLANRLWDTLEQS